MKYRVICRQCNSIVDSVAEPRCPNGHSLTQLDIEYANVDISGLFLSNVERLRSNGIWRYSDLLPINSDTIPISLGEGNTPMILSSNLANKLGIESLFIKYEGANPTGTFKDRCQSIALTKAKELRKSAVAIASAGNAAAAASAYAAKAGLKCWVFVPSNTPRERIVHILLTGGLVIAIEGSINDCSDLVDIGTKEYGWYPVTTAAIKNLYQGEGPRTIAYELWEQLGRKAPDWIIAPIGGGGLLSGIAKGWRELLNFKLINRLPKLIAVQPSGCAPLIRAYEEQMEPEEIQRWGKPTSIASSIADPFPMDGARALRALRNHGGHAVSVSDDDIVEAESELARIEGIFVEPASATTLAALKQLLTQHKINKQDTVVLIASGSGYKDMNIAMSLCNEIPTIPFNSEAMFKTVEKINSDLK
jgi:threonine synthase